jgi:hypothetical protein
MLERTRHPLSTGTVLTSVASSLLGNGPGRILAWDRPSVCGPGQINRLVRSAPMCIPEVDKSMNRPNKVPDLFRCAVTVSMANILVIGLTSARSRSFALLQ